MSAHYGDPDNEHRHTPRAKTHSIPMEVLDDIASRFIINESDHVKEDLIRMCFQIELAHWYYIDEYVSDPQYKHLRLKQCHFRDFLEHVLRHVGFLRRHLNDVDMIIEEFRIYKLNVPTYGAIILNEDLSKVLIVCGYWTKTSWGFPKGKVNELEDPERCAIREVQEEIGFDISSRLNPKHYICQVIMDQKCCLYLIPGVPETTVFRTQTKREIRDIQWFPVAGLPNFRRDEISDDPRLNPLGLTGNSFFMIQPFVQEIKLWISRYLNPGGRNGRKQSRNSRSTSARGHFAPVQAAVADHSHQHAATAAAAADETNSQSVPDHLTPDFVPKAWSSFRLNKKSLLGAIESTPGWAARGKPRGQ